MRPDFNRFVNSVDRQRSLDKHKNRVIGANLDVCERLTRQSVDIKPEHLAGIVPQPDLVNVDDLVVTVIDNETAGRSALVGQDITDVERVGRERRLIARARRYPVLNTR